MVASGYKTSTPLKRWPSAANGVSAVTSGVASTFGPWVEVMAAAPADLRLATIIVLPGTRSPSNVYEVEIGIGGSGSEVPVAAARGVSGSEVGDPADGLDNFNLAIPADVIPSGARVTARIRHLSTAVSTWRVSIQYWELPLNAGDHMPVAAVGPTYYPTSPLSTNITTSASAGTYGAWVEITSATDAAWLIGHLTVIGVRAAAFEIQIGTGPSGSEQVISTIRSWGSWFFNQNAWQGGPWHLIRRPTVGPIPVGTRVAVRIRRQAAGAGTWSIALGVIKDAVANAGTLLEAVWAPIGGWYTRINSVVGNTSLTNFGPWVEFISGEATDILLSELSIQDDALTGTTKFQIGVGPAGFELLAGEFVVGFGAVTSGGAGGRYGVPFPYARLVTAGTRVAIRYAMTDSSGIARAHRIALGYLRAPTVPDFENYTSGVIQNAYANTSVVTGVGAWVSGAWVQVDSSTPVARTLTAFRPSSNAQVEAEIDMGIGSVGNEQVVMTYRWACGADLSDLGTIYDIFTMPTIIPAASRLAMRARFSNAAQTFLAVTLHYSAEPVTPIPPTPPVILDIEADCSSILLTVLGTAFDPSATIVVTRDGDVVTNYTVASLTPTQILLQFTSMPNGEYCVTVTNPDLLFDTLCTDVACGCLTLTDPLVPVVPDTECLPIVDGDFALEQLTTAPSGVSPNEPILSADGEPIFGFVPA